MSLKALAGVGTERTYAAKNYAFVGSSYFDDALTVVDISNTAAMTEKDFIRGSFDLVRYVFYDVQRDYVFLLSRGNNTVASVDVSTKTAIALDDTLTSVDIPNINRGAYDEINQVIYLTTGSSDTFVSVDASNESALAVLDSVSVPNTTHCIGVDGLSDVVGLAFYSDVSFYDVSDPANITLLDTINPTVGATWHSCELDTVKKIAYFTSNFQDCLVSIDYSDPSNLVELDALRDGTNLLNAGRITIDPKTDIAYITQNGGGGVTSIDISDPTNLTVLSKFTNATIGDASGIRVDPETETVFITGGIFDNLLSIDVSNPSSMSLISNFTAGTEFNTTLGIDLG